MIWILIGLGYFVIGFFIVKTMQICFEDFQTEEDEPPMLLLFMLVWPIPLLVMLYIFTASLLFGKGKKR